MKIERKQHTEQSKAQAAKPFQTVQGTETRTETRISLSASAVYLALIAGDEVRKGLADMLDRAFEGKVSAQTEPDLFKEFEKEIHAAFREIRKGPQIERTGTFEFAPPARELGESGLEL